MNFFLPPVNPNNVAQKLAKDILVKNLQTFFKQYDHNFQEQAKSIDSYTQKFYAKWRQVLKQSTIKSTKQTFQNIFEVFELKKIPTGSHLCAKILNKKMKAFKCYNCMFQDNSIQCVQCFEESDHFGHNYESIDVSGGCCDCGDDEKWDQKGFCKKHLSRNDKIMIDEKETEKFTKQYKFCFSLLFCLFQIQPRHINEKALHFSIADKYGAALIGSLIKFNEGSLISNTMTAKLLLDVNKYKYQQISNENILCQMFDLYRLSSTVQQITDLYISLFGVSEFKLTLTQKYFNKYNFYYQNVNFHSSNYGSLSCQLFTSHKAIKNLVQSNKIDPIRFSPTKLSFQDTCNKFSRFTWDLSYLSKLYRGVAEIYLAFHMTKGNITELPTYRTQAEVQENTSHDFFGIQKIYMESINIMISKLATQKPILAKMIKDLYYYSSTYKPAHYTVYIPQERTLAFCIFAYLEGNINSLDKKQVIEDLIQVMGISQTKWSQEIEIIMKKVNFVLNFEAMVLSDEKELNRYFSFYSFNFRKNRLMTCCVSQLIIILNHLMKYMSNGKQSIALYLPLNISKQNLNLSVQNAQLQSEDDSYIRKKKLKKICQIMAAYVEMSCTNTSQLVLACNLQIKKTQSLTFFYQSLLSNYKCIPLKEFKAIREIYIHQNKVFEQFVKNMTVLQNGKIQIKEQFAVTPLCTYYTESFRKNIEKVYGQDKVPITSISKCLNTSTISDFMSPETVDYLANIIRQYAQIMKKKIRDNEKVILNQFVVEMIKVKLLMASQCGFDEILMIFFQEKQLNSMLDPQIRKVLFEIMKQENQVQSKEQMDIQNLTKQQRKNKALEVRLKKMNQLKQKQKLASKNWGKQESDEVKDNIDNEKCCILCKQSDQYAPLVYLGFMHRSNLYSAYLQPQQSGSNNGHLTFSSCYHMVHCLCYQINYGHKDYFYCFLCRTPTNIFLPVSITSTTQTIRYQNQNKCYQRLQIINSVIKAKNSQAMNKALGIKQEDQMNNQQDDCVNEIIHSLVDAIVGKWSAFAQVFIKKERQIYSQLFKLMCFIINMKKQQKNIFIRMQNLKTELDCYYIPSSIVKKSPNNYRLKLAQLHVLQQITKNIDNKGIQAYDSHKIKNYEFISQEDLKTSLHLIDIISQGSIQSELPTFIIQNSAKTNVSLRKYILRIPDKLTELASQMGKCPNCQHVTNLIFICLICKWKGCEGCKVTNLNNHANIKHVGASLFVKVATGNIIMISGKRGWIQSSVYQNYIGQPYNHPCERERYMLNHDQYQTYCDMILLNKIQQTVRYNQQKYNKNVNTEIL